MDIRRLVVGVITLPANTRLEVTHGSQEKDGGQKPYFIKKELTRDVSGLTKSHLINLVDLTYKGKVESEMLLWTTGSQNMHISYYIALI